MNPMYKLLFGQFVFGYIVYRIGRYLKKREAAEKHSRKDP